MKLKYMTLMLFALPLAISANTLTNSSKNIVHFNTEVSQEVKEDLLRVTLFVQTENTLLPHATKDVNEKISQAVAKIKKQSAVEIKENTRTTHVRYNKQGKQSGWVARGDLVLESKDSESLSRVVSELDGLLAIENVNSLLSKQALGELEDQLLKQALAKFTQKAELIQQSLQAKGYKVIELSIHSPMDNHYQEDMTYVRSAKTLAVSAIAQEEQPSIQLENGKTNVKARVDAKIELIKE